MSPQSRLVKGILLVLVPTVEIGGVSILSLLLRDPIYSKRAQAGSLASRARPRRRVAGPVFGGPTLRGRSNYL